MSVRLTPHFSLSELVVTSQPYPNTPTVGAIDRLRHLCEQLEVWRAVAGPLRVTSGYRSPEVNDAIGGSRTSQHARGEAADVIPVNGRPQAWAHLLRLMAAPALLPIDQAILYEDAPHIHVSYTQRYPPRRELLVHCRDGRYVAWASYAGALAHLGTSR